VQKKIAFAAWSCFLVSALLASFASLCFAETPPQPPTGSIALAFYAKTLRESQPLASRIVVYELRNVENGKKMLFSGKTADDGSTTAYVDAGNWFLHAEIDFPETRGSDYAAALTLNASRDANQTIYFQRVTSASGSVAWDDNESIANALVEVRCLQDFYELKELNAETSALFEAANALRADASGSFLIKFAPVGACTFTATAPGAGNESASALVDLKEGELANIALKIKRKTIAPSFSNQLVWLALLALALLVVAWSGREYLKKKKAPYGKTAEKETEAKKEAEAKAARWRGETRAEKPGQAAGQEKLKPTKKMRNVMNALNERERRIVETLIANDGRLKQNKIFRETLIPKTSLSRALDSLERRNVVRLTPDGNTQLVELTEWFTSK